MWYLLSEYSLRHHLRANECVDRSKAIQKPNMDIVTHALQQINGIAEVRQTLDDGREGDEGIQIGRDLSETPLASTIEV